MILVAKSVLNDLERRTALFEQSDTMRATRELPGYRDHRSVMDGRTGAEASTAGVGDHGSEGSVAEHPTARD